MTTGKPAEPSTEVDRNGKGSYGRSASGFEEAVQTLRNSILLSSFNRPLKSIMFTSASPSEGKTTISVHFALAHARQKHKTLLIDCDMRRPGVHTKLGVKSESGLAAALLNGLCWRDKLIQVEHAPGLTLLPAGPLARRCADLIGANLKQILSEAESEYDLVVVDSPPLMGFPEPLQMAAAVDGVVLVAVAGETNRRALDSVLSTLRRLRAHVVGLVLNEVSSSTTNGYYYGYYGSYYAKYYESPKE
jgi:capsular exopolysaccharide synthesis family protein